MPDEDTVGQLFFLLDESLDVGGEVFVAAFPAVRRMTMIPQVLFGSSMVLASLVQALLPSQAPLQLSTERTHQRDHVAV